MLLTLLANIHEDRKNEAGYTTIYKAFEGCILTKKQNIENMHVFPLSTIRNIFLTEKFVF